MGDDLVVAAEDPVQEPVGHPHQPGGLGWSVIPSPEVDVWGRVMDQRSLFGLTEHLEALSKHGDPLEVLDRTVDFEHFRFWLVEGLGYGDGSKGGRPPFDPVSMFKALILQAQHNLSDARMEFMIRDQLSWMRFVGFDLGGPTPDENTIRLFRNRLTEIGTLKRVMKAFDWQLQKKGYIPMAGQIVDASLVPAPKQRNTDGEKAAIKEGKAASDTGGPKR
jgi:transposase, IS5 family